MASHREKKCLKIEKEIKRYFLKSVSMTETDRIKRVFTSLISSLVIVALRHACIFKTLIFIIKILINLLGTLKILSASDTEYCCVRICCEVCHKQFVVINIDIWE